MNRHEFIMPLGGAAAWPLPASEPRGTVWLDIFDFDAPETGERAKCQSERERA
jgi:hypothetical protein